MDNESGRDWERRFIFRTVEDFERVVLDFDVVVVVSLSSSKGVCSIVDVKEL